RTEESSAAKSISPSTAAPMPLSPPSFFHVAPFTQEVLTCGPACGFARKRSRRTRHRTVPLGDLAHRRVYSRWNVIWTALRRSLGLVQSKSGGAIFCSPGKQQQQNRSFANRSISEVYWTNP